MPEFTEHPTLWQRVRSILPQTSLIITLFPTLLAGSAALPRTSGTSSPTNNNTIVQNKPSYSTLNINNLGDKNLPPYDPRSLIISLLSSDRHTMDGNLPESPLMLAGIAHTLGVTPYIVQIKSNDPKIVEQDIQKIIKQRIEETGGPLDRITIAADGKTNEMAVPVADTYTGPKKFSSQADIDKFSAWAESEVKKGRGQVQDTSLIDYYNYVKLQDTLNNISSLQQQSFLGHRAGEPLAKTLFIYACDEIAKESPDIGKFIFDKAAELETPITLAPSLLSTNPDGTFFTKIAGSLIQINPDGTWQRSSMNNTKELAKIDPTYTPENEAWLKAFPERKAGDTKSTHDASNNIQVALAQVSSDIYESIKNPTIPSSSSSTLYKTPEELRNESVEGLRTALQKAHDVQTHDSSKKIEHNKKASKTYIR